MVADATKYKQAGKLLTKYCELWEARYGKPIIVNRFKMKYKVGDMIDSIGYKKSDEVFTYYFRTSKLKHPLEWLLYNFEDIVRMMDDRANDDERRQQQREITRKRVEEWEKRNEQLRVELN